MDWEANFVTKSDGLEFKFINFAITCLQYLFMYIKTSLFIQNEKNRINRWCWPRINY